MRFEQKIKNFLRYTEGPHLTGLSNSEYFCVLYNPQVCKLIAVDLINMMRSTGHHTNLAIMVNILLFKNLLIGPHKNLLIDLPYFPHIFLSEAPTAHCSLQSRACGIDET